MPATTKRSDRKAPSAEPQFFFVCPQCRTTVTWTGSQQSRPKNCIHCGADSVLNGRRAPADK